jgi:8-oxo-dGTP pyrophosphatase MutT (NUDIX family)
MYIAGIAIPPGLSGMLNEGPPVEPRPAATVVLARGRQPWEVLLMRRPGGAEFAPGAYVFPGGSVHREDRLFSDDIRGAAVRELFEEVGVLLARRRGRFARDSDCGRLRDRLSAGVAFPAALRELDLEPAFDRLAYFARWVTPKPLRRRFDTRFFLCRLPARQTIHPEPGEVEEWLWISASAALRESRITLVHATRMNLAVLADEPDIGRLIARVRRRRPPTLIEPRLVQTDEGWQVLMPDETAP